jgi:hypothetical protein
LYNALAKIFFGYTIKGGKNKMSKKKVLSVVLAASMVASAAVATAVTTAADDKVVVLYTSIQQVPSRVHSVTHITAICGAATAQEKLLRGTQLR